MVYLLNFTSPQRPCDPVIPHPGKLPYRNNPTRIQRGTDKDVCDNNKVESALAIVAQGIKCRPVNHRVNGSIPSQGTCLGCGPGPQ